jgi:membrane protease YdiL (CAAX protease family)
VISDARTKFSCSNAHVRTLAVSNLKVLCSQFPFVVAAGAVAEELFFRVSIQGGLAHAFQVSDKGMSETTIGLASLVRLRNQ